jgi:hypothetical protein
MPPIQPTGQLAGEAPFAEEGQAGGGHAFDGARDAVAGGIGVAEAGARVGVVGVDAEIIAPFTVTGPLSDGCGDSDRLARRGSSSEGSGPFTERGG